MKGLFLFFLLLASFYSTEAINPPFDNSQFERIDEMNIHFRTWGNGPEENQVCYFFIHGFCGSTFSWEKAAEQLALQGAFVVAADLPGFGYSERPAGWNHSSYNRAELCWKLLDILRKENNITWIIGGHSMGAGVAGAMAHLRQPEVKKLLLIDGTFPEGEIKGSLPARMMGNFGVLRTLMEIAGKTIFFRPAQIRKILQSAYGREPEDREIEGYLKPLKIKGTVANIMDMTASFRPETWPLYTQLSIPISIIWGEKDSVIPLDSGKRFAEKFPSAKVTFIPGAGHCPMETHTDAFLKAI